MISEGSWHNQPCAYTMPIYILYIKYLLIIRFCASVVYINCIVKKFNSELGINIVLNEELPKIKKENEPLNKISLMKNGTILNKKPREILFSLTFPPNLL